MNEFHPLQGIANLPSILTNYGVTQAVIAPGSRNAPIMRAFVNSTIECFSIVDERSAAYFALGLSQSGKTPVALICTSGTAVLNFAPAIAEAYYQKAPLIVLTADRPAEWIDQNDGQTIRQNNIFQNFTQDSFTTPSSQANKSDLWNFTNTISKAMSLAKRRKGPVHINIPIQEPLYDKLPSPTLNFLSKQNHISSEFEFTTYREKWNNYTKRLILFGFDSPDKEISEIVTDIIQQNKAVIVAENIANIASEGVISTPDSFMKSIESNKSMFEPELLITIGNSIVSKRLKQFLRGIEYVEHWHINDEAEFIDTFHALKEVVAIPPKSFLKSILQESNAIPSYCNHWKSQYEILIRKSQSFFNDNRDFSDIILFQEIHKQIQNPTNIHISNSSAIRISQLFLPHKNCQYFCNRGTSGIDGSTSTAVGSACNSDNPTILFTGDLSFFYDNNALWNKHIPHNFKIVLFNNNGGNIFRLLPTSDLSEKEKDFLYTPHTIGAKGIAQTHGFHYFYASSFSDLQNEIHQFWLSERPAILELSTNYVQNEKTFKKYYKSI